MALIIKGDRLPEKCDWCFYRSRCSAHARKVKEIMESEHEQVFDVFGEMRLTDCPLVEIPDKHGDFKDVNTIRQLLVEASKHGGIREDFYAEAMQIIDDAPTVAEASK